MEEGLHNSDIYWPAVLFLKLKLLKYARDDWSSLMPIKYMVKSEGGSRDERPSPLLALPFVCF